MAELLVLPTLCLGLRISWPLYCFGLLSSVLVWDDVYAHKETILHVEKLDGVATKMTGKQEPLSFDDGAQEVTDLKRMGDCRRYRTQVARDDGPIGNKSQPEWLSFRRWGCGRMKQCDWRLKYWPGLYLAWQWRFLCKGSIRHGTSCRWLGSCVVERGRVRTRRQPQGTRKEPNRGVRRPEMRRLVWNKH
ncbi:hypothetical protein BR93DRAFT_299209 [Coniochaeta sp. PMI_546]|nr:hypothetical protein BR93DRAFT_299209 [Coniochaeta sp. PMI_546]